MIQRAIKEPTIILQPALVIMFTIIHNCRNVMWYRFSFKHKSSKKGNRPVARELTMKKNEIECRLNSMPCKKWPRKEKLPFYGESGKNIHRIFSRKGQIDLPWWLHQHATVIFISFSIQNFFFVKSIFMILIMGPLPSIQVRRRFHQYLDVLWSNINGKGDFLLSTTADTICGWRICYLFFTELQYF